ncbi:MAG: nitroreductase family protein [Acidimicrobiia bacterium]
MSLIDHSPEMYERVLALRVIRAFTDDPIAPEQMAAILEAARWTGSSKNRQGWEFIVVDGDQLGALAEAGDFTDPLRNSTVAIALVQTPEGNPFDIGRVAQNVMLAAAALGIGSCPVTLHHRDTATRVLALPEGFSCQYAIAIGHPFEDGEKRLREARRTAGMRGRKLIDDLVHRQHHGG